jgi:FemAB family protein
VNKELNNIIQNILPLSATLKLDDWNTVISNPSEASIFYLKKTLDYYVSYYQEQDSYNLSLVFYENKKPVAIFPLFVYGEDTKIISCNGVEIIEPLFINNIGRKAKKGIESQLVLFILELSKVLNISQCQFTNILRNKLSSWYLYWIEYANLSYITYHMMVDLSLSDEVMRVEFRKSFRPLINKGLREWRVEVHEKVSSDLFDKFRSLHCEVSGRVTRPIESWNIQQDQINSGEAFLVAVSDEKNNMVGAGLFTYTQDIGVYSVGAYRRELFDKPIGHPVQMKAIETLKNKGCKWYEIGQKHCQLDMIKPTDKELSISHFKEGFSTNIIPRIHLNVEIN